MKKMLLVFCAAIMLLLLTSCEPSFDNLTVSKYPDRLIYIVGYDTELDLTGGEVTSYFGDGSTSVEPMNMDGYVITHKIDFNVPSIYVVTVKCAARNCEFAIQVIDENYINEIISPKSE